MNGSKNGSVNGILNPNALNTIEILTGALCKMVDHALELEAEVKHLTASENNWYKRWLENDAEISKLTEQLKKETDAHYATKISLNAALGELDSLKGPRETHIVEDEGDSEPDDLMDEDDSEPDDLFRDEDDEY